MKDIKAVVDYNDEAFTGPRNLHHHSAYCVFHLFMQIGLVSNKTAVGFWSDAIFC